MVSGDCSGYFAKLSVSGSIPDGTERVHSSTVEQLSKMPVEYFPCLTLFRGSVLYQDAALIFSPQPNTFQMSRFNKKTETPTVVNLAGGKAYAQSPELEFVSLLVTCFLSDKYYQRLDEQMARIVAMLPNIDPMFAAKATVFARRQYGMRSVSHFTAAALAKHLSGKEYAGQFYNAVINRPDDMTEILAILLQNGGKVPAAVKKGFATAFSRFDAYQLAKYRGGDKAVKLVDVVNLVRPRPNERNSEALKMLVDGNLKNTDTWEAILSKAGQDEENDNAKGEAWSDLLKSGKLPYFALLRNLRNIVEQDPKLVEKACEALTNRGRIKKSLVLPFRFSTAFTEIQKLPESKEKRQVLVHIAAALDMACDNVPKFEGDTLTVLDVSGSMGDKSESKKPAHIGGLFAAVLCKALKCDLMFFDGSARYVHYDPTGSALSIFDSFRFSAGSTNFHAIFQTAQKKYDRVIILSDMQGWAGLGTHGTPKPSFDAYRKRYGANPFVYSFDLAGYGSMQFPEEKVCALAGFSDKVFDCMALLETDRKSLLSQINAVEF